MQLGILLATTLATGAAIAAPADDAVARGEQLARDGQYADAIAAFKEADTLAPSGLHACLIGLAYLRLERWSQAELFFGECRRRTPSQALPSWLVLAERDLDEHVGRLARIDVRVLGIAGARFGISSFPADEQFAPQVVHLPAGRHVITAVAPKHARVQETSAIDAATSHPNALRFDDDAPSRSPAPRIPGGAGAALLVAGGLYHWFALTPARDALVRASDPMHPDAMAYDRASGTFDRRRALTLGLYGAGALAAIAGDALRVEWNW